MSSQNPQLEQQESGSRSFRTEPEEPGKEANRWLQRNDSRLEKVIELLEANLGTPIHPGPRDALQVIVLTVLSQNTTDPNALQAYENLLQSFSPADSASPERVQLPRDEEGNIDSVELRMAQVADSFPSPDWDRVRTADDARIEDAISVCGLQASKTTAIRRVLEWVYQNTDSYSLEDALEKADGSDPLAVLSDIKGIGTKTAAVTLMEATEFDICPVDTHVHRVMNRLRIVEQSKSRNKTHRELHQILPDGKGYSLHHNLLSFGREVCTARNPDCENCFLRSICPYYRMDINGEDLVVKQVEA